MKGYNSLGRDRPSGSSKKGQGVNLVEFESDMEDDPQGIRALSKVDFTWAGIHCSKKDYSSPSSAAIALEQSKARISDLLTEARSTQVHSFKRAMGQLV